jgi:cytochrome oxidase Cu insertion factor (SCO1/SenC/PrrC family)
MAALGLAVFTAAACDARRQPPPDETATPALGPADGAALPAVDTGRVAVGDTAPDFTLLDRRGEPVTLSELRGRRIILAFYRGHW